MRNESINPLEEMIRSAQSCPEPSAEARRQVLAKSVRAYHERAQKRRMIVAALLLFGVVWTVGSARQILAQPGAVTADVFQETIAVPSVPQSPADVSLVDEWQAVELSLEARSIRQKILTRALVLGQTQR